MNIAAKSKLTEAWYELSNVQEKINNEAKAYLSETDWMVTRKQETGIEIPEDIVKERAEARERIAKGELVFSKWQQLRASERPSRKEIAEAIKAGGQALQEMKSACIDINNRYKKPRR